MIKINSKIIDLVIAAYNEDLQWIKQINYHNIIIYDKFGRSKEEKEQLSKQARLIQLENIGRESHTYITHIVENYYDLADITIFTQGNPFDHSPEFINTANQNSIKQMKELNDNYWPDETEFAVLCKICDYKILYFVENDPWDLQYKIPQFLIALETVFPDHKPTLSHKPPWGAIFAVTKSRIHDFPIDTYKKLLDFHQQFWSFPWAMEIIWASIFCREEWPTETINNSI